MTDTSDPRLIRVPGPHVGKDWSAAALSPSSPRSLGGDGTELRLLGDPTGPLRLDARDGSLGRLVLPANVALDAQLRVYLLNPAAGAVRRYDPGAAGNDPDHPFRPLPLVGNNQGPGARGRWDGPRNPRRVSLPTAIAADGDSLYLADGVGRRVLVFALDTWALREVWAFAAPECPWAVVAHHGVADVLTAEAVYRYRPGDVRPRRLVSRDEAAAPWLRLAADARGRLYVLPRLPAGSLALRLVFDPSRPGGKPAEPTEFPTAAAIRDRFPLPAVFTVPDENPDHPPRYVLPEPLTRPAGREWPTVLEYRPAEAAFARVPAGAVVVDAQGNRVDPAADPPSRSRLFLTGKEKPGDGGAWVSQRLDSGLYRCQWDAVEVEFADLPPGTQAEFSTYTSETDEPPEGAWAAGLTVAGLPRAPDADPRTATDFLVDSPPGRYLWLRVRFRGDGFATPVVTGLAVRFPRRSYLEHLPAVFSEDDAGRRFLERFLAVFQAEWDRLEDNADAIAGLFDPRAAPVKLLDWLAGVFGVALPPAATPADKRRLLAALPGILFAPRSEATGRPGGTRRGTRAALREYLSALLPAVAWPPELREPTFPLVIDGFRERDQRFLPAPGRDDPAGGLPAPDPDPTVGLAGPGRPLWGPDLIGRFQLGVSSRLDEDRLVPAGPPELDVFAARAHRFRVVLPAAWAGDPDRVAALRRAIEAEKPAHAAYDLDLVTPGVRIGVQSTVGVDTILGGPPPGLGSAGPRLGAGGLPPADSPPARLDAGLRLGTDPARI
jgi:phage tail-like protein